MKSIVLTTPDPGTFTYTEGQTFYNEKLAHELLTIMAAMADEGYEITFAEDSDLDDAWSDQTTILNQQSALFDALEDSDLDSAWKTRLTSAKTQIATLLALEQTQQNLSARAAAIPTFESLFNSVAGLSSEDPSDLLRVLKAAFLRETIPDSGIYTTTTLDEIEASKEQLETIKEQLETILEAIQDLKYNDEILEVPATPRPIRIHLQGKTIQQ